MTIKDLGVAEKRIMFLQKEFSDIFADNKLMTRAILKDMMSNLDKYYGFYKTGTYALKNSDDNFTAVIINRKSFLDKKFSDTKVIKSEELETFIRQLAIDKILESGIKFSTFKALKDISSPLEYISSIENKKLDHDVPFRHEIVDDPIALADETLDVPKPSAQVKQYQAYILDIYETVEYIASSITTEELTDIISDQSYVRRISFKLKDKNYIGLVSHWKNPHDNFGPHKIFIAYCLDSSANINSNNSNLLEKLNNKINELTVRLEHLEKNAKITSHDNSDDPPNTESINFDVNNDDVADALAEPNKIKELNGTYPCSFDNYDANLKTAKDAILFIEKYGYDNDVINFKKKIEEQMKIVEDAKKKFDDVCNSKDIDKEKESLMSALNTLVVTSVEAIMQIQDTINNNSNNLASVFTSVNTSDAISSKGAGSSKGLKMHQMKPAKKSNKGRNIDNNKLGFLKKIKQHVQYIITNNSKA
jgi:hypothetical protein